MTGSERQQILHHALLMEVAQGNRVAWVGLHEAHIWRTPAPINHTLHGIATVLTCGMWALLWLLLVVLQPKPQLVGVAVDERGQLYQFLPLVDVPGRHRRRPVHSRENP